MDNIKLVPTMKDKIGQNAAWCASFEVAFKEFVKKYLESNFKYDNKNKIIENLISSLYEQKTLNDEDYYVTSGPKTFELKAEIEEALMKKFNTQSELLNQISFNQNTDPLNVLIYSIIMFTIKFEYPFKKMFHGKKMPFNVETNKKAENDQLVSYFGVKRKTKKIIKEQISPLFYNNENNFAVRIKTKGSKHICLYRTDEIIDFETAYSQVQNHKKNNDKIIIINSVAVPNLMINVTEQYSELQNVKFIRNSDGVDVTISNALQNLQFELDRKGVKVKSEAVIESKVGAAFNNKPIVIEDFHFDKPFYLFIEESSKPIVALRVNDIKFFK